MLNKKMMSYWYIFSNLAFLAIFWVLSGDNFLTNKIGVTIVTIVFGLKFDLSLTKKDYWLFKRFKNKWLDSLNIFAQFWAFAILLTDLPYPKTQAQGSLLTIFGVLIISLFLLYPLFYFRTFKKTKSITLAILDMLVSLLLTLLVFDNITITFMSVFVTFKSDWIAYLIMLISSIILLYQWYRASLKYNQFDLTINWQLSWQHIVPVLCFFIIIFPLDSALWLHPIKDWHFNLPNLFLCISTGIREEIIFRGISLSLLLWAFQGKKNGIVKAILIQGIIFGMIHLVNLTDPSSAASSVIASTIDAAGIGLLFAVIFLITKNIWVPIVIHAVWDYLQQSMTAAMNMSVPGILGLLITIGVGIAATLFTYYLYHQNQTLIEKNVAKILG